jgi:hypothetical protein
MAKYKRKKEKEDKCDCGCDDNGCNCHHWRCGCCKGGGGAVYGLGFIGSAIYFISHTSGFWNVVLAILKAMVWPVFIVMKVLGI